MIKWTPLIFFRLLFFLIAGILMQVFYLLYHPVLLYVFAVLVVIFPVLVFTIPPKTKIRLYPLFGLIACVILLLIGIIHTHFFDHRSYSDHLMYADSIIAYKGTIRTEIQEKKNSYKTEISILSVKTQNGWVKSFGNCILYIKKDPIEKFPPKLKYGDVLLIRGTPRLVDPPKNPMEFDFQNYLKYQNIFHQHFIYANQFRIIDYQPDNTLISFSLALRRYFKIIIKELVPSHREQSIVFDLLLGVKDQLDNDIKVAYSGAGLMHVLAVSGLHVGFILVIIHFFFKKSSSIKSGRWVYFGVVVSVLFLYAFITGLSASVLRAVIMYCMVALAQTIGKRSLIYNTMAASAFGLLLYNPFFIMSVGFQLSYLALLGILYLQPRFQGWLIIQHKYLFVCWKIITASLAAQLATFPLTVLYFHQFPNYFLISNLLILLLLSRLFPLALLSLFLYWIPYIGKISGFVLGWGVWLMNTITLFVDSLPWSTTKGLYLSVFETCCFYFFLLCLVCLFHARKFQYLLYASVFLVIFSTSRLIHVHGHTSQHIFMVYHIPKQSAINFIDGTKSSIISSSKLLKNDRSVLEFSIVGFLYSKGIAKPAFCSFDEKEKYPKNTFSCKNFEKYMLIFWQGKSFLIIKKSLDFNDLQSIRHLNTDYTIVQNNAIWSLDKTVNFLKIKYLIIDSSNSFSRSKKIASEAQKLKIANHAVLEKGAFLLQ